MASSALYRRAIPAAARFTFWSAADGWPLRRFDWPAEAPPRGRILFQGGRGDIPEKYLELFAHWHAQGWSITWFDWRGQGGSGRLSPDPRVGHVDDFALYIRDLADFWTAWSAEAPGRRVVMGHSMGGHLLLRGLVEGAVRPDAAVLVAPMLGLKSAFGPWLGARIAGIIGGIGNGARAAWRENEKPGATETRQSLLTHDLDRYADELWWQHAKPELVLGPPSWRWVIAAFASTARVRADPRLKTLAVPMLVLAPMADALVDARVAVAVAGQLPDARLVRFGNEAAHEVLREVDAVRNRAIAEIDLFLAARVPVA
jgi:lysophospholipase